MKIKLAEIKRKMKEIGYEIKKTDTTFNKYPIYKVKHAKTGSEFYQNLSDMCILYLGIWIE